MCGIVAYLTAYSNGFGYNESKLFNNMLFLDTLRGWDSTGVFGVSNVGNVGILKAAINAPNFMQTQEYKDFMADAVKNGMCLVGHNRAATRGSVTDANAHPFVIDDNIILVQNGTWNGSHKHIKDTEVDTETVAHIIHENENIEEALQKINAAYALIWYNVKEKSLYAIRNSQRPLFAALTKSGGTILASEANTILYSALREQVQLDGSPYELKPGYLNKWTLQSNKTWEFDGKDVDISYRPKYQSNHHQGYPFRHPFHGYMDYDDINVEEPQHQPHHQTSWGKSTVTNTIGEIIRQGRLRDWETDEATAYALKLERDRIGTKEILLEFFDYLLVMTVRIVPHSI